LPKAVRIKKASYPIVSIKLPPAPTRAYKIQPTYRLALFGSIPLYFALDWVQ